MCLQIWELMKINPVKVSIVLVALLLFQWWLMNYSGAQTKFAEFSDSHRLLLDASFFKSSQDKIMTIGGKGTAFDETEEVVWSFSGWTLDSIERKLYQLSIVRRNIISIGGRTSVDEDVNLVSVSDFIIYTPRALQLGFLGPLPRFWSGEGSSTAMTMARKIVGVTTIFYYICLVGLITSIQMFRRNPAFLAIMVICIIAILIYGYSHPNTGALLRYRFGFYMLLVSFGLAHIVQTLQTRIKSRDDRKKVLKRDNQ